MYSKILKAVLERNNSTTEMFVFVLLPLLHLTNSNQRIYLYICMNNRHHPTDLTPHRS